MKGAESYGSQILGIDGLPRDKEELKEPEILM